MSMNGMGGLNHKNQQIPTSYTNNIPSQVSDSKYQGVEAGGILMTCSHCRRC